MNSPEYALLGRKRAVVRIQRLKEWKASSSDTENDIGKEGILRRIQRELRSRQDPELSWAFLPSNQQQAARANGYSNDSASSLRGLVWKQYFTWKNSENSCREKKEISGEGCSMWGNMGEGQRGWWFYQRNMKDYGPVSWKRVCHITSSMWCNKYSKAHHW